MYKCTSTCSTSYHKVITNYLYKAAILFYSVIASLELALGLGNDDSSSSSSTSRPLSSSSSTTNTNEEALILLDHVARTFCLTAIAWSKSAVAVMLLKARGGSHSSLRPILQGLLFGFIAVVNTVLAAACLAHWFRCMPIAKEWDDSIDGSCWSMSVHGAIGIAAQSTFRKPLTFMMQFWENTWHPIERMLTKSNYRFLCCYGCNTSRDRAVACLGTGSQSGRQSWRGGPVDAWDSVSGLLRNSHIRRFEADIP